MLWEWDTLVCAHDRNLVLATGAVALAGAAVLLALGRSGIAIALIALGLLGVAALASKVHAAVVRRRAGLCGALLIAPVLLRRDATLGFAAILFLFAVVWLTDIAAYFVGRAVGRAEADAARQSRTRPGRARSAEPLAGVVGGVVVARQFGIASLAAVAVVAFAAVDRFAGRRSARIRRSSANSTPRTQAT